MDSECRWILRQPDYQMARRIEYTSSSSDSTRSHVESLGDMWSHLESIEPLEVVPTSGGRFGDAGRARAPCAGCTERSG